MKNQFKSGQFFITVGKCAFIFNFDGLCNVAGFVFIDTPVGESRQFGESSKRRLFISVMFIATS